MAKKLLDKLSIRECRHFLNEQSAENYPTIYPFIKHYVRAYDNYESQYIIRDRRN